MVISSLTEVPRHSGAGIYNVYNILAAYSVARLVGIDGEKIAQDIAAMC